MRRPSTRNMRFLGEIRSSYGCFAFFDLHGKQIFQQECGVHGCITGQLVPQRPQKTGAMRNVAIMDLTMCSGHSRRFLDADRVMSNVTWTDVGLVILAILLPPLAVFIKAEEFNKGMSFSPSHYLAPSVVLAWL